MPNELATTHGTETEVFNLLRDNLYPGAKDDSVRMVMEYCRVNQLDPFLKAVHIVPTSVKVGDRWETRDIIMVGIALYRVKAARAGMYVGKSEPEFGPMITTKFTNKEVSYPEWCRITVKRLVASHICEFTATEYWVENYATMGRNSDDPNAMWSKRPRGQLAKCAESQALRMAFPEFGGTPTAEEMEGKTGVYEGGPTIDGTAEPAPPKPAPTPKASVESKPDPKPAPTTDAAPHGNGDNGNGKAANFIRNVTASLSRAENNAKIDQITEWALFRAPPSLENQIRALVSAARQRVAQEAEMAAAHEPSPELTDLLMQIDMQPDHDGLTKLIMHADFGATLKALEAAKNGEAETVDQAIKAKSAALDEAIPL